MAEGQTVVMSQSDAIHESFYDLFNQRFRRIDDPNTGVQYYANIAIGDHTKPCKVHPQFQCVVIIKKSDVEKTAAPLLNRFEKYFVTHSVLLEAALNIQPPCLREIVLIARSKVMVTNNIHVFVSLYIFVPGYGICYLNWWSSKSLWFPRWQHCRFLDTLHVTFNACFC